MNIIQEEQELIPEWAQLRAQGQRDGSTSSVRRKSLECCNIIVSINDTEFVQESNSINSGYHNYVIDISTGLKQWKVKRRYRDFKYLDEQLKKYMSIKEKPNIPPKRLFFSSNDKKFVEERRIELEKYLKLLVLCNSTWNISDFVRFIDNEENTMMILWNLDKMKKAQEVKYYFILISINIYTYIYI